MLLREPLKSVAAGYGVSLGVTTRREVTVWGARGAGVDGQIGAVAPATPLPVHALSSVRTVAAGEFQCAAIDETGALFTWGLNLDGALGRSDGGVRVAAGARAGIAGDARHRARHGVHARAHAGP